MAGARARAGRGRARQGLNAIGAGPAPPALGDFSMTAFSTVLVGDESLLIQCAERLRARGHAIAAVVTDDAGVRGWAQEAGLRVAPRGPELAQALAPLGFDWLLSIANLRVLPDEVLSLARKGAVNFHDGPLPRRAGLNAPLWALLEGDSSHGVTWHLIEGGVDEGDILAERAFELAPDETALTLNARCYAAALDSFEDLLAQLESGVPARKPQDLSQRRVHRRADRPEAAARLDFRRPAAELAALGRALDHGTYFNPLAKPKFVDAHGRLLLAGRIEALPDEDAAPGAEAGAVLEVAPDALIVAVGSGRVRLSALTDALGARVAAEDAARVGAVLPSLDAEAAHALTRRVEEAAPAEARWRARLAAMVPAAVPLAAPRDPSAPAAGRAPRRRRLDLPAGLDADALAAIAAAGAARGGAGEAFDLALREAAHAEAEAATAGVLNGWVPVRFEADPCGDGATPFAEARAAFARRLAEARRDGTFARDLVARDPAIAGLPVPDLALLGPGAPPLAEAAAQLVLDPAAPELLTDPARLGEAEAELLARRIETLAAALAAPEAEAAPTARLPVLPEEERARLLREWNATEAPFEDRPIHQLISAQAARAPDAPAIAFEDRTLTYAELEAEAERVAHALRAMGVGPGVLVGLCAPRGPELVAGALGILKAGGAYVPLDPSYPAERLALYVEDSGAPVIVAHSATLDALPPHEGRTLVIDRDLRPAEAPATPPEGGAGPEELAYVIYTSGSTGRPKGVMVTHRNVANFFAGMDARIPHDPPGTWLAVTSLSFDISVLELFWTLARGFKVVIAGDDDRGLVSNGPLAVSDRRIDFSLFYWGNDDGPGPKKYQLLLEGAKFADAHGFCAVWTPERHFHAFGGPYPNPAVTGAAVAAVTRNLSVRAGSCVAPLHHTARIAEEWAVIDNLTDGRAALAIASGWQPDDFVLRPENTPPANKPAMFRAIEELRRLWRGEAVEYPRKDGSMHAVVTQPRPVSAELPIWVTTAGNPETWREAGAIGANVLTHLLGQSIDEVADKIRIYRDALREAGHDPDSRTVTLMLHTYIAEDREKAREIAREPMKDYLRAAAGLIKQYAWAFPAFKRPKGVENPFQIDLGALSAEELEGILDFAFKRYFEDSGLFGTIEDALARVEQVKRIGVDEIACLIDYGIAPELVLEGLRPLAEVLARANRASEIPADDFSIAAQILRHGVTHLQCTPSMARMIVMNDEARLALSRVRHLMIGGEALPGALAGQLAQAGAGAVQNMYGPTETTIWSATGPADPSEAVVNIGTPIANTRLYVLDAQGEPAPIGAPGELWIGGAGVTRGYLGRQDLTDAAFRPDPFAGDGSRMYRTGDLARRRMDGRIDFLGRADHQVKIRGHRIELGEIEAAAAAFPGVRAAAALAREDAPGDVRLALYVVGSAPEAALRAHLAAALPAHMLPAHVIFMDALPLTPNRKVDRKALPAPGAAAAAGGAPRRAEGPAPEGDAARRIAAIWSRVLGVDKVSASDNFFELGGHSLLAVQAHREIRAELGAERLSITDIFRFPVLSALAAHLEGAGAAPAADPAEDDARAQARAEAMARRRAMRARRGAPAA